MSEHFNFHKALQEQEGRRVKITLEGGVQLEGALDLIRGGSFNDVQAYRLKNAHGPTLVGVIGVRETIVWGFAKILAFEVIR